MPYVIGPESFKTIPSFRFAGLVWKVPDGFSLSGVQDVASVAYLNNARASAGENIYCRLYTSSVKITIQKLV
jgi:hypothetical protein